MKLYGAAVLMPVLLLIAACTANPEIIASPQGPDTDSDAPAEELDECLDDLGGLDLLAFFTDATLEGVDERVRVVNEVIDCGANIWAEDEFVEPFVESGNLIVPGLGMDRSEAECVLKHMVEESPDPGRTVVAASTDEDIAIIQAGFVGCLDEDSLATFLGEEGTGPQAYGDDDRLDSLYDDCEAGSDEACDLLFFSSSVGSEYERLAASCGGRSPEPKSCVSDLSFRADGQVIESSPGLERLNDECQDGGMTACDLLFFVSPLGSEYENTGFTCGGEAVTGGVPDCRTQFG